MTKYRREVSLVETGHKDASRTDLQGACQVWGISARWSQSARLAGLLKGTSPLPASEEACSSLTDASHPG
jgi:hypothetical protein